jgi:hypothetical protein
MRMQEALKKFSAAILMLSLCRPAASCQHLYAPLPTIPGSQREDIMDVAYVALVVVFWFLIGALAVGCAKLGGPKQ